MSIIVKGLDELQTKLDKLSSHLNGSAIKQNLSTIGEMVKNEIEESFDNEKSPFGGNWKPLKESTKKQKHKRGKSSKILRSDGNLADNWVTKSSKNKVTISNNASANGFPYGLSHQFGSSKRNIPKRPFLPINSSNNLESGLVGDIMDFLEDEITQVLK